MSANGGDGNSNDRRMATGQRYLFFDDYFIENRENLTRNLHTPKKRGAVLEPDQWWEKGRVSAFSPPLYVPEEDVYKWVYRPYYKNYSALAVSGDGVNWEKPDLGVYEFEGQTDHSIFSDRRILQVVEDPDPPESSRRYLALADKTPVASPDLVHWEEVGAADLPGGDSGTLTYDEKGNRFLAPVKVNENHLYRQFDLVESTDFKNWTEARPFMYPDERDQELAVERIRRWLSSPNRPKPLFVEPSPESGWAPPEDIRNLPKRHSSWNAQIYNVGVFPYHGYYVAILAMYYPTGVWLPDHKNTAGFSMLELAVSRDMEQWTRLREPFIEPATLDEGIVNNYERMFLGPTSRPVVREDELLFYYTGSKEHMSLEKRYSTWSDGTARDEDTLTELEKADLEAGGSAVYLATLRRDGLVSLDADVTPGMLLTEGLEADGESIYLNLACDDGGYVVVELFNADGEVAGVSRQLSGDQVKMLVEWEQGRTPDLREGAIYKIRITLRSACLYAVWFE